MFNIVVSGGVKTGQYRDSTYDSITQIDCKNFEDVKHLTSMEISRKYHQSVYCRGNIYMFSGYGKYTHKINCIETYSLLTKTRKNAAVMFDKRGGFCACAFIDQIFIIGGYNATAGCCNSCLRFDTNDNKWKEVAKMKQARALAACAVFEGRIVVSGGCESTRVRGNLKTVEAYDLVADAWSCMPGMITARYNHSSFAVRNKLVVIKSETSGLFYL